MSPVVVWSPGALACVQRLYRFLAEKNQDAAKTAAELILKQAELLEMFPNIGRPAEDLESEHREIRIPFGASGYVLLYRFAKDTNVVTVLAVRHQRDIGY